MKKKIVKMNGFLAKMLNSHEIRILRFVKKLVKLKRELQGLARF